MSSFTSIIYENPPVSNDDIYALYTNLALYGERILSYMLTIYGVRIGFAGDLKVDLRVMKPTLMLAIPRVMDFMSEEIKFEVSKRTGIADSLFRKCYQNSLMKMEKGKPYKRGFWNNIAFREIRESFGGRLRLLLTGSTLPNIEAMKFISICLGCSIYEAYGLVEAGYSNIYSQNTFSGCLGGPAPGWEAKLVFTPDIILEDIPKDMYGELWLRHEVPSTSYLTQSTSDNDNWVHTGDIFKLTNERFGFCFIERIQYIMHTKCGFAVCPQKLESLYRQNPYVAQMIVYTDKSINGLVSVVVVDERTLHQKYTSMLKLEEVRDNLIVKQDIIDRFNELARDKRLRTYEYILDVCIEIEPWTTSDLISECLKLKRYAMLDKYKDCLQTMISRLNN
jgi:long-chain acyl-CoA synthetase